MKIIVSGGRKYNNKALLFEALDQIHKDNKITMIVNGGATGADFLSTMWAIENKVSYKIYKAEWDKYGKAAGFRRNKEMISSNMDATFLLAFPGGNGTNHAKDIAKMHFVEVIEVYD